MNLSSLALFASGCLVAVLAGCGQSEPADFQSSEALADGQSSIDTDYAATQATGKPLIDYATGSIVGRRMRRNALLAGLVAENGAVQNGATNDRLIDINEQQTTTAHLLSLLLADTPYTAKFVPHTDGRARLVSLTLQDLPPPSAAEKTEDAQLEDTVERVIHTAETNEERTRELAETIATADPDEVTAAIDQIDITPGGVELLASLVDPTNPVDIQLAAMKRLDLADEYAAKGLVLGALQSPSSDVVLAAIESIDMWRDPTILPQINALLSHKDKRIRQQAKTLSDDLQSYIVTRPPGDPYDTSYSGDRATVFPDIRELQDDTAELLPQP